VGFEGPLLVLVVIHLIHIVSQGQEKTEKENCNLTASVQNNDFDFSRPRVKNRKIKAESNLFLQVHLKISGPQYMIK